MKFILIFKICFPLNRRNREFICTLKLFLYFLCFYPNFLNNAKLRTSSQQTHGRKRMNEAVVSVRKCQITSSNYVTIMTFKRQIFIFRIKKKKSLQAGSLGLYSNYSILSVPSGSCWVSVPLSSACRDFLKVSSWC